MKRQGDFYNLTRDCADVAGKLVRHAPGNIHTTAASSVVRTADLIKSMPVSSAIKNRCPSSGQSAIVDPVKGCIGCPEEGCWAWWDDAGLERYPEHERASISDAQGQDLRLSRDEWFQREVLGYVAIEIPRRPSNADRLLAGSVITMNFEPIEIASEHVPAAVLKQLATGRCESAGDSR